MSATLVPSSLSLPPIARTLAAALTLTLAIAGGALAGCGGDDGAGPGPDGDPVPGEQPEARYKCCLNDASYSCPDLVTMHACAGTTFDLPACHVGCGPDSACHAACDETFRNQPPPDPSPCDPVDVAVDEWCVAPPAPSDCTIDLACDEPGDCVDGDGIPLPGYWCNREVGRCYDLGVSCLGTRCGGPGDCPDATETCDPDRGVCVGA